MKKIHSQIIRMMRKKEKRVGMRIAEKSV